MTDAEQPFWKRKTLDEMSPVEWESLCDGCARCCVVKIPGAGGRSLVPTSAACRLLDGETARCTRYKTRARHVADCVKLTPALARTLSWLPPTCAYRRLARGLELPDWHPLVSDEPDSVQRAGISMSGRVISQTFVHVDDLVRMRIRW
jgi:uncharacterized cysteine cluster protein YcgN (CxxCxxCC family)